MSTEKAISIASGSTADVDSIKELYLAVAAIEGGLARTADEISRDYVEHFVSKSVDSGIIVIARDTASGQIIGEIHGYPLGPNVFAHLLGELTIAVHPGHQGARRRKAVVFGVYAAGCR